MDMPSGGRRPYSSPLATILLIAAIGVGVIAYTEGDPRHALSITPPWQPGEESILETVRGGKTVGKWALRVEEKDGQSVIISDQQLDDVRETSSVFVHSDSLLPIRTEYSYTSPRGVTTYVAEYTDKDVSIKAQTPFSSAEAKVDLPSQPKYFDNEQLAMVLRALPLNSNFRGTIWNIITQGGAKTDVTCQVMGREHLKVPAGEFDTWIVELRGTGRRAWIAVDPPHQLVQYENRKNETTSQLARYSGE